VNVTYQDYLILGLAAFLLSGLLTWPVRKFAIAVGAMDKPTLDRKTQKEPIPYLGGIAIALAVTILTFAAILGSDKAQSTFPLAAELLIPAIALGAMGLIDDLIGLNPFPRLVLQTVVATAVTFFLIASGTVGIPLAHTFIDEIIMGIWIVGLCNSINFFDNHDGGAAGTVAVSTVGIALIAFGQGQELVSALAVVTAGATLGFLMWNKSPAKIYMGDAGALFLGVIVSVLTIRLNPGITPKWNSIALMPMLLAVPLLDTSVAVFSRLYRKISPLTGGKDHLSHRLMRKGLSKKNTAFALWGAQAVFVGAALVVYQWTSAIGTELIITAAFAWIAAFVWFWRIPSTD